MDTSGTIDRRPRDLNFYISIGAVGLIPVMTEKVIKNVVVRSVVNTSVMTLVIDKIFVYYGIF